MRVYFGTKSLYAGKRGWYVFTDQQSCIDAAEKGSCNRERALSYLMGSSCATDYPLVNISATVGERGFFQFSRRDANSSL